MYFDFETTTGDSVFFDSKMYVVSYCQIYTFHPGLNLDKIVIFRSFQQNAEEIYDLNHFKKEHVPFFNKRTFFQLKYAASAFLACEKSTSLAQLFSVELKFTVDSLNDWFTNVIKLKFLELSDVKKQIFIKGNKIIPSKTTCCICGFLLNVEVKDEHKRWYNFEVQREHLFLRNIFTPNELKEMRIDNIEEYYQIIDRLVELFPEIENVPDTGDMSKEFKNFLLEDFNDQHSTLREMKDYINHIVLPKKLFFENKFNFSDKIISFIDSTLMKFVRTNKVKGVPLSKIFIENLKGIIKNKVHVHHSHVTDEVIGYTHSYCNLKVRENKSETTVVVHNLFRFDFFFLMQELRAGVWRTRDIKISGKNPANISFANIGNQIMFLDTIKYFQQSFSC